MSRAATVQRSTPLNQIVGPCSPGNPPTLRSHGATATTDALGAAGTAVDDVTIDDRWPRSTEAAARLGVRSVSGNAVDVGEGSTGALEGCRDHPLSSPLPTEDDDQLAALVGPLLGEQLPEPIRPPEDWHG